MVALLPISHTARCVMSGNVGPTVWANVFNVDTGIDFMAQSQVQALADGFYAAYVSSFKSSLANNLNILECVATDLSNVTGAVAQHQATTAGSNASTSYPVNIAACITWRIARHYRGGHPRTYLPGVPASASTDGHSWGTTYLNAVQAAATAFLAAVGAISIPSAGPVKLVAVHRTRNKVQLTPPESEVITAGYVDSRIDTQRRRLGRDVP